ncbi:MAG TPA: TldD/PmbA family protein [Candidatus Eisenbacteria bacterium]|nr:TldD/PmbA family protein [Candidatus Eisenbacteria bacterium]
MPIDEPISRRVFLRRGALASAAALLASGMPGVPWLPGSGEADAAIMGMGQELSDTLNVETCNQIIIESLKRGGTFSDLFAEQRYTTSIVLDGGKLESVTYGYPRGAGVHVMFRQQAGYAFSDDIDFNSLLDAGRLASNVVENRSPVSPVDLAVKPIMPIMTLRAPAPLMNEDLKFGFVRRFDEAARATDPRIASVRVEYNDEVRDILIATSDGVYVTDRQYLVSITCTATAVDGSERRNGFSAIGGRVDEGYFTRRTPEAAGREAAEQALVLLQAGPAPAGSMPVVTGPGWGGVLMHEALGHALEGEEISRGTSIITGKLGTQIGSPLLRVVDDSRIPFGRGSYPVDDEGTIGQKTVLVDRGVLVSYLLDRQNASILGLKSTGNGRRMNYRHRPLPRMSNTYIDRGQSTPDSLVTGIKKGLYAAMLGVGGVDTTSGNFNFAVREGYLIENGQITRPVQGAVIVGNALDALQQVEGVGNDLFVETAIGTCTKETQSIPVGVGQPTVRFASLTVGGTAV